MLMVVMDLFPVGLHQLAVAMTEGYAFARSQAYIQGETFQFFTQMRGFGVLLFVVGGVLPLVWFMVSRWFHLKPAQTAEEQYVVPKSVLALTEPLATTTTSGGQR
jgi:nitric oxide reductase subunit B